MDVGAEGLAKKMAGDRKGKRREDDLDSGEETGVREWRQLGKRAVKEEEGGK